MSTPDPKKVLIASDHAGVALKAAIQKALPNWKWVDLGPTDGSRVDYPDYAEKLCEQIGRGVASQGILICGSGIGMSMAANKMPGIRAALVENPIAAQLSKEHNNANVLCLGSRFLASEYGSEIARTWLESSFNGDERHSKRIQKISKIEERV
jgi:ribose 5-phosphate isomerase B